MLERLGEDELASELDGDGAGSLVEAWASGDPDGRVAIAVWNGTLDQSKADRGPGPRSVGHPRRSRACGPGTYELRHHRVDARHSNIVRTWKRLGRPDWPDDAGWTRLRAADRLETLGAGAHGPRRNEGRLELEFELPMPAMSLDRARARPAAGDVPRRPHAVTGRPPIAAELRNRAGLAIELLDNGSLFAIRHGDILVNQVLGSPVEGGLGNVYLRRRTRDGIASFPLLGPASPSRFRASGQRRGLGGIGRRARLLVHAPPRLAAADLVLDDQARQRHAAGG